MINKYFSQLVKIKILIPCNTTPSITAIHKRSFLVSTCLLIALIKCLQLSRQTNSVSSRSRISPLAQLPYLSSIPVQNSPARSFGKAVVLHIDKVFRLTSTNSTMLAPFLNTMAMMMCRLSILTSSSMTSEEVRQAC